jgi:cell division septum initiation protein DivIVA
MSANEQFELGIRRLREVFGAIEAEARRIATLDEHQKALEQQISALAQAKAQSLVEAQKATQQIVAARRELAEVEAKTQDIRRAAEKQAAEIVNSAKAEAKRHRITAENAVRQASAVLEGISHEA